MLGKGKAASSEGDAELERDAFVEERRNLSAIEDGIASVLVKIEKRIRQLKDATDWHPVDAEGRASRMDDMRKLKMQRDRKVEFEAYVDSPYFAHVDIRRKDGEIAELFIGERALVVQAETLVIDWRSDMGGIFYNKQAREFTVKGQEYSLLLRRAVSIKDAQIKAVRTEFDAVSSELEGDVVDPFLISVLRDKRRDYKLSDIIRTIQHKQNDILRLPLESNFIVQGCAGSGKTMILLHRLSYLAFNYKESVDFSRFAILTPSDFFNDHVDELSDRLGLSRVQRYTTEDYYVHLIRRMCAVDIEKLDGKKGTKVVPKIKIPGEISLCEDTLGADFLSEVYSQSFVDSLVGELGDFTSEALKGMAAEGVFDLFNRRSLEVPSLSKSPFGICSVLEKNVRMICRAAEEAEHSIAEAEEELRRVRGRLEAALERKRPMDELFDPARAFIKDAVPEALRQAQLEIETAGGELKSLQDRKVSLESRVCNARKKLGKVRELSSGRGLPRQLSDCLSRLNELIQKKERLTDANEILMGTSELDRKLRATLKGDISRLESLYSERAALGFLSFGKKRAFSARIEEEKRTILKLAVAEVSRREALARKEAADLCGRIDEEGSSLREAASKLQDLLDEYESQLERVTESIVSFVLRIRSLENVGVLLENLTTLMDGGGCPELDDDIALLRYEPLHTAISRYKELLAGTSWEEKRKYGDEQARTDFLQKQVAEKEQILALARTRLLRDGDQRLLDAARHWMACMDVREYWGVAQRILDGIWEKNDSETKSDIFYRHQLFVLLVACRVYYGKVDSFERSISIDEAQDLSVAEYWVLRFVLGDDVVFNLYGDLGQRICSYRGLASWDEVQDVTVSPVYCLDQNYRNTRQITRYCNKRLKKRIIEVGVDGAAVRELGVRDALRELFLLRSQSDGLRVAMIHARGLVGLRDCLGEMLGKDVSWGVVDMGMLSVLDVEASKGLEFDAVIVVTNCMTDNERYIAFTRALDNLFVCEIEGLNELSFDGAVANTRSVGEGGVEGPILLTQGATGDDLGTGGVALERVEIAGAVEPELSDDSFDAIFDGMDSFELDVPEG